MKRKDKKNWKDIYYVDVFELARSGMTKQRIMRTLGLYPSTFYNWMKTKPALREAYYRGRKGRRSLETFKRYVYNRLPRKLKKIWKRINALDLKKNGLERIETILLNQGKQARQHLFIHAYITSNFNASEACRIICIPRQVYEDWYKNDPDFHDLFDGMIQIKKDFFDGALVGKVKEGDTSAIIFANRTFNADRGYGTKINVEHSGQIDHRVAVVQVKDLNLSLETQKELLEAIRERNKEQELKTLEHKSNGHSISE